MKDAAKVANDAEKYKLLITVCSGCGRPYTPEDAAAEGSEYHDCGCPAGTHQRWNAAALGGINKALDSKKIDWEFIPDAKPQGSSNDFWYDLTDGGYVVPEKVLQDERQIEQLKEAIRIVESFEGALEDNELLNQF